MPSPWFVGAPRRVLAARALLAVLFACAAWGAPAHALPEQIVLNGLKTPNAFSLAIDAGGNLYTVDNKPPSAVRRVTPGGCEAVLAASPQLDGGRGIAVGPDGTVYVGATVSHNLIRIRPDGTVTELMNTARFEALTGVLTLFAPLAVTVDADGSHVYVSEVNSPYIARIDTGTGVATIAYPRPETPTRPADPLIGTKNAKGIVVAPDGTLYLAAGLENKVLRIPADDAVAATVVLQDDPTGIRVQEPYSVRLDHDGNLYVAAYASDNVLRVTPGGAVTQLLRAGDGLPSGDALDGPRDLTVTADGTVFVVGAETNFAVFRIPPGGPPARIDDPLDNGKLTKPKSIVVDHSGNVYATGELSGTLVRIATQPGPCGNGRLDQGESCDYSVGEQNCCCTLDCTFQAAGTACSTDANECTDDRCDGADVCAHLPHTRPCTSDGLFCTGNEVCSAGACVHTGDPCVGGAFCNDLCDDAADTCARPAGTPCPEDENPCTSTACDGSGACLAAADHDGALCRAAAGACDRAEFCDGVSPDCPADLRRIASTICRESVGVCDVAESCDGVSADCPLDTRRPPETVCRVASGACDLEERCDGTGADCPSDGKRTTVCRPADGACDVAEACDGIHDDCPANGYAADVVCRPALSQCDQAEVCSGLSPNCPDDVVATPGLCRAATGECDVAESCDGISALCPSDGKVIPGTRCLGGTCNPAGECQRGGNGGGKCGNGEIDLGEDCDLGAALNGAPEYRGSCCRADCTLRPDSFECRTRSDVCFRHRTCASAVDGVCPTDFLPEPEITICRKSDGECDVAENCDGTSGACPADAKKEPATPCSAGTCDVNGVCRRGGTGGGTCGDGVVDDGEDCDLGTTRNGAPEDGESCCTSECTLRDSSFRCRLRDSVCQKDRTCADSNAGACPASFQTEPDDQLCSPLDAETVNGCTVYRCDAGVCAQPICAVDVQPVTAEGAELPRTFAVTCQRAGRTQVESCGAVGYLNASAILGGARDRARSATCQTLASRYEKGCANRDPLYPYCRMVEKKLGQDGILTGKCKRIVDQTPKIRTCLRWLKRLGQPECAPTARAGFVPIFRVETTLTNLVSPVDQIPSTTVVKVCDRSRCTDLP